MLVYTREIIGTNRERDVRELALKNALADLRCTSGRKTFEMGEFGSLYYKNTVYVNFETDERIGKYRAD